MRTTGMMITVPVAFAIKRSEDYVFSRASSTQEDDVVHVGMKVRSNVLLPPIEILKIAGSGAICHLIGRVAPKLAPSGCAYHFPSLVFTTNRHGNSGHSKHPQNCPRGQLGYGGILHVFHLGWVVGDVSEF